MSERVFARLVMLELSRESTVPREGSRAAEPGKTPKKTGKFKRRFAFFITVALLLWIAAAVVRLVVVGEADLFWPIWGAVTPCFLGGCVGYYSRRR